MNAFRNGRPGLHILILNFNFACYAVCRSKITRLSTSSKWSWTPRLNIITGETGAGKSILLGALGLLLGAKNDGSAMKDAARNCTVEGFSTSRGATWRCSSTKTTSTTLPKRP